MMLSNNTCCNEADAPASDANVTTAGASAAAAARRRLSLPVAQLAGHSISTYEMTQNKNAGNIVLHSWTTAAAVAVRSVRFFAQKAARI